MGAVNRASAQETAESRAFKSATRWFETGIYDTAEREFGRFVAQFPQSPMLAEAILLQARAALEQTNLSRAISILTANLPKAGLLTDQYRYRLGTAYLQSSNFTAAAEAFALIVRQFPNSGLLLEAAYGEALARFRLREFSRVVALLQDPKGAFQLGTRTRANDPSAVSGLLLLAEALFEQGQLREAEAAINQLSGMALLPEPDWDRQYLLCRIKVASQRLPEALTESTNLVRLAAATDRAGLVADSIAIRAGVLRQLDRIDEAIQDYTNNLAAAVPADRRRMATLNIIELKLAQDQVEEAEQLLRLFVVAQPDGAASDIALLSSGELQLKMHFAQGGTNISSSIPSPGTGTNHLQLALARFEKLLEMQTNSPLRGKAWLNKGWCLWLDDKIPESATAFRAAAAALPFSEDLAMARFKLADALFREGDYTNAVQLYRSVTNDFAGVPRIRDSLFDQALYQMVRASIALGDGAAANEAMKQVLEWFPESSSSERSLWLVGQELIRGRQPENARQVFSNFVQRFPDRPLRPKVELAIARTYFHEGDWPAAIHSYQSWLSRYLTNELRPRAEFNYAWANYRAGRSSNAFELFTNFVATFPTDELAPQAQRWVGDEFYRRRNYVEALRNYQAILENTNWPVTALTYQARMMAGRAAFAAQLWKNAEEHFTALVNDVDHCPAGLAAEGFFALGDTLVSQDAPAERPTDKFALARRAFERIIQLPQFATNRLAQRLVPLAWGRIGDCSRQLASRDAAEYKTATDAYGQAISHPLGDISTRSLAEFGLAYTLEIEAGENRPAAETAALLKEAFDHYFAIVIGQNLRADEKSDPVWIEKAGFAAARLKEAQRQWPVVIEIYQRMFNVLEPLRPRLQEKIKKAAEQSRG
jgi:TolA-binding protein